MEPATHYETPKGEPFDPVEVTFVVCYLTNIGENLVMICKGEDDEDFMMKKMTWTEVKSNLVVITYRTIIGNSN